jgi:hypothetical protein
MKRDRHRLWTGFLALAFCSLAPAAATAGVAAPIQSCSSSLDCSGCSVCVGGKCQFEAPPLCRCDAECQIYGDTSCWLSRADRPLCGGSCGGAKPDGALVCGEGSDAWILETSLPPIDAVPAGATLSSAQLEVSASTWSPVDAPAASADAGCSLAAERRNKTEIWPLLMGLALLWRRR